MSVEVDFLVIGSGLAGLTYALNVAQHGSVALLTKRTRSEANSSWAQGGIAGVIADDDSFELHKKDTLIAGAGLCHEDAVEVLVSEGPERIRELMTMGAQFNTETDAEGQEVLSLGREGGHSRNRIVHTADYTGWECERTLLEAVRQRPEIQVYEHYFVTDLIMEIKTEIKTESKTEVETEIEAESKTASQPLASVGIDLTGDNHPHKVCRGARVIHSETGHQTTFRAHSTLLATGGCGHIYQHTTNPLVATGDGVAIAWRAGAAISNMEFIQFHPTTLYHPDARAFLITEALRGEGGILKHGDGEEFMARYHELKELAPRDIVARAIVSEMKRRNVPCVYLDVTHVDPEMLRTHFPTVYERCLSVGIDITQQPIPIVPAQHYQCGGVLTDLNGATTIRQLYAAGEVACTGVHGANRLASNSLLEAMVFGHRAAQQTLAAPDAPPMPLPDNAHYTDDIEIEFEQELKSTKESTEKSTEESSIRASAEIREIRQYVARTMQQEVGIVRSVEELIHARAEVAEALAALSRLPRTAPADWETLNIATVSLLVIESALFRHESRGLHAILDYPNTLDSERHDTVLVAKDR